MGKNLSDFADTVITKQMPEHDLKHSNVKTEQNLKHNAENIEQKLKQKNVDTDNIKKSFDKYRNYSQNELMQEFIKQKNSGGISNQKVYEMIDKLSPFISTEQKEFLHNLVNKTDE